MSMWKDVESRGEEWASFPLPSHVLVGFKANYFLFRQVIASIHPQSFQAIQLNSDASEWALIPSPTLCLPQTNTLGIHDIGNCDIQKRLDLESALGPHISSAIYWVTWVRSLPSICTCVSHQQSEYMSALACVPLSHFWPALALRYMGRAQPIGGLVSWLVSGLGYRRHWQEIEWAERTESRRVRCPWSIFARVAGLFVILRAPCSYHHLPFTPLSFLSSCFSQYLCCLSFLLYMALAINSRSSLFSWLV